MVKTLQHNMSCLVSDIRDPMSHLDALLSKENVSYDEYRRVQSQPNNKDKVCIFYFTHNNSFITDHANYIELVHSDLLKSLIR